MRVALFGAVMVLSACATDGLNLAPPPGVDFSGHWRLNAADSDDPMHLLQIANAQANGAADGAARGGRSGRGGAPGAGFPSLRPPAAASVKALSGGARFPGKQIGIQHMGRVLT